MAMANKKGGLAAMARQGLPDVLLEMGRRYIAMELPDYAMNNDRMFLEMRDMVERMATQIVLCEDLPLEPLKTFEATTAIYWPKNIWEMWKRDHAPNWLKDRWPVKHNIEDRKVKVKMSAAYPRLPMALPKYGEYRFHYSQTSSLT